MAIFKYLDDFLPGRNVNDFVFTVLDPISNEELTWYIEDVLDEINRDRSAKWTNYTKDDWYDGWHSFLPSFWKLRPSFRRISFSSCRNLLLRPPAL